MPEKVKANRKARTPIKPNETKAERFNRIAKKRMERILKNMDLLGNCGNRNNYEYTQEQVSKIFVAISSAIDRLESSFTEPRKEPVKFDFEN